MKKLLLATAGLLSLGIVSASAADVAPRMATKAPEYVAPALYNWTGPYLGINGGYAFSGSSNSDGWLGGGTLGYNVQTGPWVFGLEGDMNWTNIEGTSGPITTKNNWLATVRGRIGYAMGPTGSILPYVTGGAAFGDISHSVAGLGTVSDTNAGWTLGGGIEAAISGPWTAKLEYLYVDLGDGPSLAGTTSDFHTNIVRVGLNYRF